MTEPSVLPVTNRELFSCAVPYLTALVESCEFPWEMLPKIREHIDRLIAEGLERYGFTEIEPGVFAGEGVTVAKTATIVPPAVIGAGTEIRPGAYLRGYVITGPNCVLGNSSEFKNCVLMSDVQCPHFNYVGDSILGNRTHTGAAAVCSNLKADKREVVIHGEADHPTGLQKVGAFLGDDADVGCACVLNPGTVIGQRTVIYPNTTVRGVIPADCIMKAPGQIVRKRMNGGEPAAPERE